MFLWRRKIRFCSLFFINHTNIILITFEMPIWNISYECFSWEANDKIFNKGMVEITQREIGDKLLSRKMADYKNDVALLIFFFFFFKKMVKILPEDYIWCLQMYLIMFKESNKLNALPTIIYHYEAMLPLIPYYTERSGKFGMIVFCFIFFYSKTFVNNC